MTDDSEIDYTKTCPCGQAVEHWELAKDDQFHPPFPPPGKRGVEIPIFVDHADGVRHLVMNRQVAE